MKKEHRKQLVIGWVLTVPFCVGGLALIIWGSSKYIDSREFSSGAQSASGKVVGFETYDAPGSISPRDDIHYAMVRYETADGQDVLFRGPSRDGLVRLNQGDEVDILYYPGTPEDARVDTFMGLWFAATILWGVGGGAIVIPLLTMWQAWKSMKQQE
jgi:hypothetical protein